jgi:enoyl-CoA hydratase
MDDGAHRTIRIENRGSVRLLILDRGKANALDQAMVQALHDAAREAQDDGTVRGVVLTSASPRVFCGGFDLAKMGTADRGSFGRFIRGFEALFYELFLYRKPLVAALPGHAVAGGALLAGTADFRWAAEGNGTIGLPEASLGVHVPRHFLEALRATVGDHALTRWTLSGGTVPFSEAVSLGAVDRILPPAGLLDAAVAYTAELGTPPSDVYASVKRDLRTTAYEKAREVLDESRSVFVESWFSEAGQKGIAATLARLQQQ